MTPLRERMVQDMQVRNLTERTIDTYVRAVAAFALFFSTCPSRLGLEHIRRYQVYLVCERKVGWSVLNIFVCAVRFLYQVTLRRDWKIEHIPYAKRPRRLPVVLSRGEVRTVLHSTPNLMHRAIFTTLYACGLRISEALALTVSDIDSKRMVVNVRAGKGRKDRTVPLPQGLLDLLREYWLAYQPRSILFPGKVPGKSLGRRHVATLLHKKAAQAGVTKTVTPHTLRHTFATHHLEGGTDVRTVQILLGHASLRTTTGYLHIANDRLLKAGSPLDQLDLSTD